MFEKKTPYSLVEKVFFVAGNSGFERDFVICLKINHFFTFKAKILLEHCDFVL